MRLEVVLAVYWTGWQVAALSISHWDLEGANRTCEGKESCADMKVQPPGNSIWMDRNCQCDDLCANYGDCCPDSTHFQLPEQRRGAASFACVGLRQYGGVYMRTTCPPDWGETSTRAACETASQNPRDPLAGTPATDLRTGVTYRNLFCAICHRAEDLDVWHPRMECPHAPHLTSEQVNELLFFQDDRRGEKSWGLNINDTFYPCNIDPSIPSTSENMTRRCISNVIKTCAVNWTNVDVRARCEAYTTVVYEGDTVYRNPHCAMCNNVPLQRLQCQFSMISFRLNSNRDFNPSAFAVLFDLSGGPPGKKQPCNEDQLYDPFFKRCRSVLTEFKEPLSPLIPPIYNNNSLRQVDNNSNYSESQHISKCAKFLLEKDDFVVVNNTVYVSKYRKRFREGEFNIKTDGRLEICAGMVGRRYVEKFDTSMGYITFAGLGVSIIFLLLHLTAFCLVPELRNLSGKNLASLCVALLIAYMSFMAGQVLRDRPCFVIAVITFYAFLASFIWMLTMAFDVWRTLRLATEQLRVSAGKQWHKFIAYSLWSWLLPAFVVMLALWAELSPGLGTDWRPGFGTTSCWFGRSKPLLIFFAVPLGVVMLLNITFFSSSAHMVYSTTSTTRFTASAGTQRDFRLYLRLALVMGLTWTMGLFAGTLDIDLLWYLFILLNTLQGLFIFLAFTCNDKVIRGLALRRSSKPEVIPRSFSWSTDSTTRKSHVESEKTMDTLY